MSKHEPTKRKLEEARKTGQIAKSPLLSRACGFAVLTFIMLSFFQKAWVELHLLLKYSFLMGAKEPLFVLLRCLKSLFLISTALLVPVIFVGVVSELAQLGFRIKLKKDFFDFKVINPIKGISKVITEVKQSWMLAAKCIFLGMALVYAVKSTLSNIPVAGVDSAQFTWFNQSLTRLLCYAAVCYLVLGIAEYKIKARQVRRKLMMTDQEVRQEHKDDQGDGMIKHQRRMQHQMLSQEMVAKIRKAKVLVVERA